MGLKPGMAVRTLCLAALVLTAGCSRFHGEYRKAALEPVPNDISGAWDGTWASDANGHGGRLRCIITRRDGQRYDAWFWANYKKILSFEYTVPLTIARDGTSYRFTGEADLGKLAGGVYTYKGAANPATFISTYDNKHDHGKFQMERPRVAR